MHMCLALLRSPPDVLALRSFQPARVSCAGRPGSLANRTLVQNEGNPTIPEIEADEEDSDTDSPSLASQFRQRSAALRVDADAEFEQMAIHAWMTEMLEMRLPSVERDTISQVLQSDYVKMAVQGFIAGEGPWRRRIIFFYQVPPALVDAPFTGSLPCTDITCIICICIC